MDNLRSAIGIVALMAFAWLLSTNRRRVNWRVIAWGVALQLAFAFFLFRVPAGTRFFLFINDIVVHLLGEVTEGARFCFGALALPPDEMRAGAPDEFALAMQYEVPGPASSRKT